MKEKTPAQKTLAIKLANEAIDLVLEHCTDLQRELHGRPIMDSSRIITLAEILAVSSRTATRRIHTVREFNPDLAQDLYLKKVDAQIGS